MTKAKEVKFRLTESELKTAKWLAGKYDMSVNALARFLVLNLEEPAPKTDREFMKKLNGDIGRIGNNVNQIARKVNASPSFYASEKEQILKSLWEIRNETRRLAGKEELSEEDFRKEGQAVLRNKRDWFE